MRDKSADPANKTKQNTQALSVLYLWQNASKQMTKKTMTDKKNTIWVRFLGEKNIKMATMERILHLSQKILNYTLNTSDSSKSRR